MNTLPKDLSKKIINDFVSDCEELIPEYPLKDVCDDIIKSLENIKRPINKFEEENFLRELSLFLDILNKIKYIGVISNYKDIRFKSKYFMPINETKGEFIGCIIAFPFENKIIKNALFKLKIQIMKIEKNFEINNILFSLGIRH